jgi:hypothetical protein
MRTKLQCVLFLLVTLKVAAAQEGDPPGPPRAANPAAATRELGVRIEQWIRELGSEQFEVREAAMRRLAEAGHRARAALERATTSDDAEIASRAKALLEKLPRLTHTIVDALGQPIPSAAVTIEFTRLPVAGGEMPPPGSLPPESRGVSEEDGRIAVPEIPPGVGNVTISVSMQHPDYGLARALVETIDGKPLIQFPMVRRGTEADARSIKGQVVGPGGEPVSGAAIECSDIRTPGDGLIEGRYPRGAALTDQDGRFSLYLPPSEVRAGERGVLIPANSRYGLQITVPGDDSYFPWAGRYSNLEPVRIEVPRAERFHRFRFEAVGGGWIEDPQELRNVRIQFDGRQDGERLLIFLGENAPAAGKKLVPGDYFAEAFQNGKTLHYLPLTVAADSPEELTFRLPHAVTYRGRVVEGTKGEPVAGAFVMAHYSSARSNLALLTAEDWKLLKDTPSNPGPDHPAVAKLGEHYGVQGFVRTDAEGRFEITRQPDQEYYGLMAFAEGCVPYSVTVGSFKPDDSHRIDVGELPLFPAAKLLVRPVHDGRLSVAPRWFLAESGQPEWFSRFQAATAKGWERDFVYVHWLALNELQPVYVPAGVELRVLFETPYDDQWGSADVKSVRLDPRAIKEIGDLRFAANLPLSVRVVDRQGRGIEGLPVRQMQGGDNAWSVAHNTDADGLAKFYAEPNSSGRFWISDMPGPEEIRNAKNLYARYEVKDQSPQEPATITITDEQATLLLGPAKPK